MKAGRIIAFCICVVMSVRGFAQVRDSIPMIIADSLKAVYIYADTGKAMNRVDAQGRKQGLWEKRYPNGKLRYRGHFYNNNPNGVFKYYWDNDSIQNLVVYSNLGKTAYARMFYENGGVFSMGKFISEKRDSIWLFYDPNLKLFKKEQYINGKKEGKSVVFYSNSNVEETKTWHNDVENGPWLQFYENGQLKLDANYANGKLEGVFKLYSLGVPDDPEAQGTYHSDNREGKWIYRNNSGNGKNTVIYKHDKVIEGGINKFTPHELDSLKMQNQELQQKLNHPPGIEEDNRNGGN
jgi:antitoxin component YwqK of YwqJK toxin-antitoxin module